MERSAGKYSVIEKPDFPEAQDGSEELNKNFLPTQLKIIDGQGGTEV
jgi:hypothetical protein